MDDVKFLTDRNEQFIEACRQGSWEMLEPILTAGFSYLDGSTGEVWQIERYIADLRANPLPALAIDEVRVHVDGDAAIVSARTTGGTGKFSRYLDTYARREDGWRCVHASVWPIARGPEG